MLRDKIPRHWKFVKLSRNKYGIFYAESQKIHRIGKRHNKKQNKQRKLKNESAKRPDSM